MAAAWHVAAAPHTSHSMLSAAANVHLLCALGNGLIYEADEAPVNPFRTDLAHNPLAVRDGCIEPHDTPGLGLEIDEAMLADYPAVPGTLLPSRTLNLRARPRRGPREAGESRPDERRTDMKLGMFMHPIHDYRRGYHTLLNEDMDVIRCADAVGFDEVWLGEHFALPSEPIQSPLMLMAALIPETERIKLCTGVICLPNQHPAIVAGQVAQFDHMAKGRFMFGIGPGATPPDFEMFKILDADRMAMLEESIDMILGIWSSDPPYAFHGKYWDFEIKDQIIPDIGVGAMGKPYQDPHPPIMLPAMSRGSSSIRMAARRDWHSISANFVPSEVLKEHWGHWCDEKRKHSLPVAAGKWRGWAHPLRGRDGRGGGGLPQASRVRHALVLPLHHRIDHRRWLSSTC